MVGPLSGVKDPAEVRVMSQTCHSALHVWGLHPVTTGKRDKAKCVWIGAVLQWSSQPWASLHIVNCVCVCEVCVGGGGHVLHVWAAARLLRLFLF